MPGSKFPTSVVEHLPTCVYMTCTPEEPIFSTDVWPITGGQATRIREIGVEGTKSRYHRQQGRRIQWAIWNAWYVRAQVEEDKGWQRWQSDMHTVFQLDNIASRLERY